MGNPETFPLDFSSTDPDTFLALLGKLQRFFTGMKSAGRQGLDLGLWKKKKHYGFLTSL